MVLFVLIVILPVQLVQDLVLRRLQMVVLVMMMVDLPRQMDNVSLLAQQVNGRIVAHVKIVKLRVQLARVQL